MHGKNKDARRRIPLTDMPDGINAAPAWHLNIHNDDSWLVLLVGLVGARGIYGFGDDFNASVLFEKPPVYERREQAQPELLSRN